LRIRKAVIPAAGFGTRFLPATKSQPKEMLPVIDRPLIQYSVEEAVRSGIEKIAIITSQRKSSLKAHFGRSPELEEFLEEKGKLDFLEEVKRISGLAEYCYIPQKKALGLGHAILMSEEFVGREPFAVLLPDDIFDCDPPCIRQLINVYSELKSSVIVLGLVDKKETGKYGIIKPRQIRERVYQIEDLAEKPAPEKAFSNLGVFGRYVFHPDIFGAIKKTAPDKAGEIQITDAIKLLLKTQPVYGFLIEEGHYDCGDKLGFIEATISLALKRPEFGKRLREHLESLKEKGYKF
jgi:UTP--glucose-1-phosphate uridylyltransferase